MKSLVAKMFLVSGCALLPLPYALPASGQAATPMDTASAAKKFGTLASLTGTTWTIGQDEVIQIKWDRPGAGILIDRRGLYGRTETIVAPSADGRGLRYIRRSVSFGDVREATVPIPGKGEFMLRASTREREICRQSKKGTVCGILVANGKKWLTDANVIPMQAQTFALTPVNTAKTASLLKIVELAGDFSERPEGSYHPTLGVIALAANKLWANGKVEIHFEAAEQNGAISLIGPRPTIAGDFSPIQFSGTVAKPMAGSYLASVASSVNRRRPVTLNVREGGAVVICHTEPNGPKNQYVDSIKSCNIYRIDTTGRRIMRQDYNYQYPVTRYVVDLGLPQHLQNNASAPAAGKSFRSSNGTIHFFYVDPFPFVMVKKIGSDGSFGSVSGEQIDTQYRVSSDGQVFLKATSEKLVEMPRTAYYMADQADQDARSIAISMRVREINRRDDQAFWSGFSNDIAQMNKQVHSGAFNSATWKPSMPADWGAYSSGARVGDMGGVSHTRAPAMTPAQRQQQQALEAFELRERIYGSGSGSTASSTLAIPSNTSGGNKAARPVERRLHVFCYAKPTYNVSKADSSGRGKIVSHSVKILYTSQFGEISREGDYVSVLNRLEREMQSMIPKVNAPDWYQTGSLAGCIEENTYEEARNSSDRMRDEFMREKSISSNPKNIFRMENVLWQPSGR